MNIKDKREHIISGLERNEELLQKQLQQQETVTELGLLALSGTALGTLMKEAVIKLKRVLSVEYTKVLEMLPGGEELVLQAGEGWNKDIVVDKSTVDTGKNSQAGYTLNSKKPVIVKDLSKEKRFNGPPLLVHHRVVSGMSCVIWGRNNKPYGVLGTHTTKRRDFTSHEVNFLQAVANILATAIQRKEDEEKLQEGEKRKSAILESSRDAIITIGQDDRIVDWNAAAEKLFGFSREQAIGKGMAGLIIPQRLRKAHQLGMSHYLSTGEGPVLGQLLEMPALRADGSEFLAEISIAHTKSSGPAIFSATMRDITERKRAEEILRESEERFRATFDEAALAMSITDLSGMWIAHNQVYQSLFGYSLDELKQMDFMQITHPDDRKKNLPEMMKLVTGELSTLKLEKRYLHKNGSVIWGAVHLSTIKDAKGRPQSIIAAIQDITERKQAEEKLKYQKSLLEAQQEVSPLGILVVSQEGKMLSFNQLFMDMWKFPSVIAEKEMDEMALQLAKEQLIDPEGFLSRVRKVYQTQEKSQEKLIFKDGRIFKRYGSPIRDEDLYYGYVWFFQDITEQENLAKQKDDFIGIASHELKTPVTSIKAYTEILHSRLSTHEDKSLGNMLEKMDTQINRLTSLITDLLDVTKIEQGQLQFRQERFGFNKLVSDIVDEIQSTIEGHTLILSLAEDRLVFGDRDRIGQVITNILTNAVKYSKGADKVIVKTQIKQGELIFSAQDFGLGLSKEDHTRVFERFYRAGDPRFETYPGLGLGLYISSGIIQRHNGKMWVDSKKGEGSTFYFSLPYEADNQGKASTEV